MAKIKNGGGDKQAEYSMLDQNNETNNSRSIVATWNRKKQPPKKPSLL